MLRRVRTQLMNPYAAFAKNLETGIRWSNLMLAETRLSLLQLRLLLREGKRMQSETMKMHRLGPPRKRSRKRRRTSHG